MQTLLVTGGGGGASLQTLSLFQSEEGRRPGEGGWVGGGGGWGVIGWRALELLFSEGSSYMSVNIFVPYLR